MGALGRWHIAIGGVGEAAAVIVGDWGVAWGAEALEVARVHLQGWVIVALDDVAALPFIPRPLS